MLGKNAHIKKDIKNQRSSVFHAIFIAAFLWTSAFSGLSVSRAQTCQDLFNGKTSENRLVRDLNVDLLLKNISDQYQLSEIAQKKLREAFLQQDDVQALKRQNLVQYLVHNPQSLSAIKTMIESVNNVGQLKSTVARAHENFKNDSKDRLEVITEQTKEYKELYTLISPVVSLLAPFVGGVPAALLVTAVHSIIPGTTEEVRLKQMKGMITTARVLGIGKRMKASTSSFRQAALGKLGERVNGVLGDKVYDQMIELGACTASACVDLAKTGVALGKDFKQKLEQEYSASALFKISELIVELELSQALAQMALDFQAKDYPITRPVFIDSPLAQIDLQDAFSPQLIVAQKESDSLSLSINHSSDAQNATQRPGQQTAQQAGQQVVVITGDENVGKSILLSSLIGQNVLLAYAGALVPAKSLQLNKGLKIETSMLAMGSYENEMSRGSMQRTELKEIVINAKAGQSSLILLDEPLNGTSSDNQIDLIGNSFPKHLAGLPSIAIIVTHNLQLAQALTANAATAYQLRQRADGTRELVRGITQAPKNPSKDLLD